MTPVPQKAPCLNVARPRGSRRVEMNPVRSQLKSRPQSFGVNVLNPLQAQRPKATDASPWYGVSNRGFGLLEVLVSALLGSLVFVGITGFYLSTVNFYEQSSSQTFLQRQATLIIDEMARRVRFANGLVANHPSDCPASPSLKVTQPDLTGFYCFYQTGVGLLERRPDGSDFDLLKGPPVALTLANLSFTVVGGKRATINFQLNDDRGNTMAFTTDLATQN